MLKEIGEHSIHSIMKNSSSPSRAVDLVYVFLNMQLWDRVYDFDFGEEL
jgi:hypothetical protein